MGYNILNPACTDVRDWHRKNEDSVHVLSSKEFQSREDSPLTTQLLVPSHGFLLAAPGLYPGPMSTNSAEPCDCTL